MFSYIEVVMHMFKIILLTLCLIFLLSEDDLLYAIERIVTKRSNPSVHHLTFSSTLQLTNETIKSSQVNFISDIRIYNYKIYRFQIQK